MTVDNNLPSPNGNIVSTSSTEIIRVLHIDDEEDQQMFLKVFVEGDSNIKVTSARSAEETIELVETGAFDCLISDYDMPDMDGITLAKKIRETSNIPIIIYTGRGSEEVAESAFASGIDDYIRKEVTPAHYQIVSKRIRQAVERRRSNESYRNLFDNASDAISIVAFDRRIIDINEMGCRVLGYSKEELLKATINKYVASPGFDFNDYLEKIVRKGHSVFEATHITKEGKLIPVEVNAKVIKYMGVDAILSFTRDISDRKRLESQMKERLEALQNHALELSKCEDIKAVAETTYQIVHETMGYTFFDLGIVQGDTLTFLPEHVTDDYWTPEYPLNGPGICGKAVETGLSIVIPDVRAEPRYIVPKTGYKYLSEIVVPVKIEGKVVAVINIEDEKRNRFTRDDVILLEIFSEHVASSIHRINLINSTKSYLSKLEKINKHSTHLTNLQSVVEVAEYSFNILQELIGFCDGCIGIVEGDFLKFKYARNLSFQIPDLPLSGKGITIRTCKTGKTQLIGDTRLDPEFVKDVDPNEYLSELDVPVKIDGRVVAVINLEEREPHFFSEEDREIVEILADQIASAISRIQHHETIKVAEKALVKSEKRFKHILDSAPEGVTVNIRGKIVYVNKQFSDMIGYSVEEILQKNIVDLHSEAYKEQVLHRTRRRSLGEDVASQYEVELEKKDGSILPVEYSVSSIAFDGERASLTFIRDVSHKKEKQLLQDRIAALHKHAHALNGLLSLEDVAETTLQILHTHMNCNLLSIRSSDGENLTMLARWGEEPFGEPLPIRGKGLLARAAREKQTLLVNDTRSNPDFIIGNIYALSELVVPILGEGELLGVLNAESLELNAFGEDEKNLVEALADEVGSAIMRIKALELEHVYNYKLEVLQVNAIKLSQAGTIDEALDTTCEILEKIFGYSWVGIGRVGEESIHYVRILGSGLVGNDKIPLDRRSITVRAIKSGATQLVKDTSKDEDYIVVNPGDAKASSELVVPIRVNGRVEFVMNLESMKLDAFSDQEKHLIELLALHFGSAVELIRKREKLNSIHLHASRLGSVDDIGDIAKLTLDTLKEVLNFKICSFHVVKNEVIEMIATIGFKVDGQFTQLLSGPGLIPYAVRECRPIYAPDVTCDEHYMRGPPLNLEDKQSSEFVVPITIDGVSFAAINLEDKRTNGFTDEDRELVEFLSEHVASAMQRINHYEVIKASEEKYRSLLDASFDGMIMASGTKITYTNQSIVKLLGYNDQSELIGLDASDILLKDDYESMRRGTFRIQSNIRLPNKYELKLLKKDGKTVEVEASFTLTEFEGKPVALVVIRDISESKRFERQMVALRDHAYSLPETSSIEEVCQVTLDAVESVIGFNLGSFLIVNGSDLESIGNRGSPNLGRPIPIDGVGITAKAARRMTSILVNDVREDSDFLQGTSNSLSELAVPVILDGKTVAVLNFESPELNAFNEVDQRLLETFAVNVSSAIYRIRELEKLRSQNEEKARELMGGAEKIVSMVHNDLRTPLQMIQNASYLLRRRFAGAEEYTSKIDAGVEYAAKILDDLKMMMSPPQLKLEKLEYNDLVKNCLEDVNIPSSLSVDARYGAPVLGEADSYKIRRVVDSLVKNAVEAMPGGGTLSVRVEAADEMAIITIGDTGQGIPDDVARSLFTPFYTTKSEGIGLGLAICKQIVEAHGGRITFESRVREGTSFTVALPLSPRILSDEEGSSEGYIKNSAHLARPNKRKIDSHR